MISTILLPSRLWGAPNIYTSHNEKVGTTIVSVLAKPAGMARAALAQDDLQAPNSYVSEIMSYLGAGGSLNGTWDGLRIYIKLMFA